MVERSAAMAARAMGGEVIAGDPEVRWRGLALDSRRVAGGEIFFALPGERADGHDFVADAARRGAAAIVVHRDVDTTGAAPAGTTAGGGVAWVRVADTYEALHALTRAVRAEVPRRLVGLTGSAGKTTAKELLALMLGRRFKVEKSLGNFNNTYGFPVALMAIADDCDWMVAEMGMSTPGELGQVSRLGRPDAALLLNVRPAHLENFADLAAIADAKAEILDGLVRGGLVVANADDPQVMRVVEHYLRERDPSARLVRFAVHAAADVRGSVPEALGAGKVGKVGCRFSIAAGGETVEVVLPVHGLYNAENCLAAAACAHALGIPLAEIRAAAAELEPPPGRGDIYSLGRGITLIDDSYNSNPDAAEKALESARLAPGERWLAVLGDMLELGPTAPELHRRVGARAAELGFEPLVGVGELARETLRGSGERGVYAAHFSNAAEAAAGVPAMIRRGDAVLVKGSRGVGLEVVVEALRAAFPPAEEEGD